MSVTRLHKSGFPGFDFDLWYGLMAPAKTPKPILDHLSRDMRRILAPPEIRERMAEQGVVPRSSTPEEFDQFLREEVARLGKIVRASGARAN